MLLTTGALTLPMHAERPAAQPAVKGIWEPISYSEDLATRALQTATKAAFQTEPPPLASQ